MQSLQDDQKPQRTSDKRTWGIVNLPLALDDTGNYIIGKEGKPITDSRLRYLFFELDSLDEVDFGIIYEAYFKNRLPFYVHRTMRGYHFLSVKPIAKELHAKIMKSIKPLNPDCPHITIRIKPNKWIGEREVFKVDAVLSITTEAYYTEKTYQLKKWMERQFIGLIRKNYKVVNYPFNRDE